MKDFIKKTSPIFSIFSDLALFMNNLFVGFARFFQRDYFVQNLRTLRWNKLDSYIMSQFFLTTFGSIVLFISIYELSQIFLDMKRIPEDANFEYLNLYYLHTVPYYTFILQPFGFLFATVYVLSKLSTTREMIAMISTGTSIYRLTFYMMAFSIFYYFFTVGFLLNSFILPSYQKAFIYRKVALNQAQIDDLTFLKDSKNFTIFGTDNMLYLGEYYNATEQYIENATVLKYIDLDEVKEAPEFVPSEENSTWLYNNRINLESLKNIHVSDRMSFEKRIDAEKLYWSESNQAWIVSNGTVRLISEGGTLFSTTHIDYAVDETLSDPYWVFEKNWYPIDAMSVEEALQHMEKLKRSGKPYHRELSRFYSKDAYPLGIIFVVMIGIGIVNMASKKVSIPVNSAISMALFVVYYLLYTSFLGMARRGDITPLVGGFGGSAIFGILAFVLYARTTT